MDSLAVDQRRLVDLCRRWRIVELALFGSFLRGDNTPDSDVDLLVTFDPRARWSLFDFVEIQEELSRLLERKVDLVSRRGLERSRNPIRPKEILSTAKVIYASEG
jgi:predicted nucleotidyltransferase